MAQDATGCFSGLRSIFAKPGSSSRSVQAVRTPEPSHSTPGCEISKIEVLNDHTLQCNIPCAFSTCSENDLWSPYANEPPPYNTTSSYAIYRPEVMETIDKGISSLDANLRDLSLKIHDHPELAFHETYAHDTLTAFMHLHGFKITPHYTGLQTAWKAEWSFGKGGRTLGINSEMDALPGIGHGYVDETRDMCLSDMLSYLIFVSCGHNLIAISGVGVALAVKAAMEMYKISGKIVLLGTPAEEGGGGKVLLIKNGAYKDMDLCIMCHPAPGPKHSVSTMKSLAIQPLVVEYFGHSAHAAAFPWEGQNALDAAVLAYTNISVLRQQMKPDCRVHGIIEGRSWEPNIIPDYAKMKWIVRAPSYAEMTELLKRVRACIEAAALATSCRSEVALGVAEYDLRQNPVLSREFIGTVSERYGMSSSSADGSNSASTDFGNVTYELPAIHPSFAIPTVPNGGNHTIEFAKAARTPEAHAETLLVTKGLALVGVRALEDDAFFDEVRKSFKKSMMEPGGPVRL
ncbi:hypothetical protein DFH11DRAFT_1218867 [Phellopilus nigrolimitatus]|nr:hypothetical protein DFH11DRAFT_1218867 [Phellopilus nigrolimitatus]